MSKYPSPVATITTRTVTHWFTLVAAAIVALCFMFPNGGPITRIEMLFGFVIMFFFGWFYRLCSEERES